MVRWKSSDGRFNQARRPQPWRPKLEALEGRCLPSTVTNLNDSGDGSLRQAILDTPAGGTVDFQPGLSGTITLTTGELLINEDLTITGPGADVITVSGNDASRVFEVAATFTVNICGLTIAHGSVTDGNGGGIANFGALNLTSCVLSDNSASGTSTTGLGGGVYSYFGTLTVTNSTIAGNSAGFIGGGVYTYVGTLTVGSSTLSGNSATEGGGIFNDRATAEVTGCTFSGNSADRSGGGIFDNGTLTVTNSTLSGNSATEGGGIVNTGTLTLTDSTLSDNSASFGGAIRGSDPSTTTITDSTFSDNFAGAGGAMYLGSTLTLTSSVLSGNFASDSGGAIYNFGTLTVASSTFSDNSANGVGRGGGAIYNSDDGRLTLSSSTLTGNSALSAGGGIFSSGDGDVTVTNSTVSGSSANYGGGIYFGGRLNLGRMILTSCTVSGNSAGTDGGGIDDSDGRLGNVTVARNTLIAGNTAPGSPDLNGLLNSQGHNLIGDGTGGTGFDPTDLVGTADNPIDPLLGPLADNGGPTQTMALLPGSPAIDAGDNTNAPDWDQRGPGFPRIVNGTIDIGAFEVQADAHNPATGHSLADPVAVPEMPNGALPGQRPDLPANPLPLPEFGIPEGPTCQSEPVPVPTAAGRQAPGAVFSTYPGTGQPVANLDSWSASDLDTLALDMLGGP